MAEYIRLVEPMECDYHRHLPPSAILSHCLSVMQCDFVRSGCGRGVLQQHHGAVWMISSMRIFQYSNICVGDTITYKTRPRVIEGKKYVFYLEIFRGAELAVRFDTNFIAVKEAERRIVPVEELECHWSDPPGRRSAAICVPFAPTANLLTQAGIPSDSATATQTTT